MRLVIDALELNYARQHIDTFVIASGDSDFCPLANKLRENDKRVIGLAVKQATSPFFVRACDEFLYLPTSSGRGGGAQGQAEKKTAPRGKERGGSGGKPSGTVPPIAREVVRSLLARATGPVNPSLIKETLVRKEPDFDEREHGFSTFSRMLEAMEKEKLLKRQQLGRQWYITATDQPEPPEGAVDDDIESYPDPED
jgi:hypothetical protein